MFHLIPDAMAVTRHKGLYRQCKVYKYNEQIFVQHGSGFIYVRGNDDTSHPDVRLVDIELPFAKKTNRLGYIVTPDYKEEK